MKQTISLICILNAAILGLQSSVSAETDDYEQYDQSLGSTAGRPITNGFIIFDGEYVSPPYVVTRDGPGIYINGRLVEQPCPWPIPEKHQMESVLIDPAMPTTITKNTTQYDKDINDYLGKKISFYKNKYGELEMVKRMVAVYRQLPCVKESVAGRDENYVRVTWADGNTIEHRLIAPQRKPTQWTRETLLSRLEKNRNDYEDRLEKGDFYFLGKLGRMTGTFEGAQKVFQTLLPVLAASKNSMEVQQKMEQAGYPYFDAEVSEAFFNHRQKVQGLESRLVK